MLRPAAMAAARRLPRGANPAALSRGRGLLLLRHPARLLHSSERATQKLPGPDGLRAARGAASWGLPKALPAWIPCSGSVSMVLRTAGRGFRSTATRAAEATEGATVASGAAAEGKLYLGYAPRVWAMGAGHCAFVMLGSMYLMTDMVLLRVLGIVANAFDMFYCFLVAEAPLW